MLRIQWNQELSGLQRKVEQIRVENCYGQKFVPEDGLRNIITREVLSQALSHMSPNYFVQELTEYIIQGAVKVFTILLMINHVAQITTFVESDQFGANCVDNQLPFDKSRLHDIFEDEYVANLFHEKQWEYTAPVFTGAIMPRGLERWTILPFIRETHTDDGGFGALFKLTIHPCYHPPAFRNTTEVLVRKSDYQASSDSL